MSLKDNTPLENLTPEQKHRKDLVDQRVNDSWNDIKKTFGITDRDKYFQLDISNFNSFQQGKGVIDAEQAKSIYKEIIAPYLNELPVGSIRPLILINNDGKEVIFAYKEKDGSNIVKISTKTEGKWIKTVDKKQGEPVTSID